MFGICVAIEIALLALDYWVNWNRPYPPPIRRLFNIAREDGLASWFAITQTFVIALVLWAMVAVARNSGVRGLRLGGWVFAAILFTFLAADDGSMIHERIGSSVRRSFDTDFWPTYEWQLVYLPILALCGLVLFLFLWRELSARNTTIVFIALCWLAVAIGLDFVEGIDGSYEYLEGILGADHRALSHFSRAIEEFLEMFGMTLMLVAFLDHLLGSCDKFEFTIVHKRNSETRETLE